MFSLMVVALFFLMILAPCLIALGARRDMAVPGEDVSSPAPLRMQAEAFDDRFEPAYHPATSIEEAEAEVAVARRAAMLAESAALAAEARLAMARARLAADQAALASRAASQAAEALERAARPAGAQDSTLSQTPIVGEVSSVFGTDLPESHPSMDFPRSRVSHRAA